MTQEIHLTSADKTAQLAQAIAPLLTSGATLLLDGPVGAGKTHFARHLIFARMAAHNIIEDVPSPTFTLVQTYDLPDIEIWHADLYRLTDTTEVYELGLEAAFDTDICLVEWPDRLGELTPQNALSFRFDLVDEFSRKLVLQWQSDRWDPIVTQIVKAIENDPA